MNDNVIRFGEFVEQKRKAQGKTLRGFADDLGIAAPYLSDIEKGRRYPPDKEKLQEIARLLMFSEEDKNRMLDLAAMEKENTVSSDLPDYIMHKEIVRVALRKARDANVSDEDWEKFIGSFEDKEGE